MFGWDDAFLLAMIAAGTIKPMVDQSKNKGLIQIGKDLEKEAFNTNMEVLRTQNSEASLNEIQSLRTNVADQIALNAARGTSSGAGSAQTSIQKSEQIYASDEQSRRMNLLAKENELRASNVLSGLHTLASETQMGQSLTNQIFNNLPVSTMVDKWAPKGLKEALPSITKFKKSGGFGFETI